jgi:hypothetical protein
VIGARDDAVGTREITSTRETIHGLIHLSGDRLLVQWRTSRSTDRVGKEIRTDRELEPVREVVLPLSALAGAKVRWSWFQWPPGAELILTAADLRTFEEIAGEAGLRLEHPAVLAIRIGRAARAAAREFVSEVELALAEQAIQAAEQAGQLSSDGVSDRLQLRGPPPGPNP